MPFHELTQEEINEEYEELMNLRANDPRGSEYFERKDEEFRLKMELVRLRKQNNLTQIDMVEKSGLTQQAISRLEKDKGISPKLNTLISYLDALGYKIDFKPKEEK